MSSPLTRWSRRLGRRTGLPLLIAALAATGCDSSSGPSQPGDGPGDNPEVAGLRLSEQEIRAQIAGNEVAVSFVLHRAGSGSGRGTVWAGLYRIGEDAALAEANTPFVLDAAAVTVPVSLPFAEAFDAAAPATLADYVVRYRVQWDGAPVWGRRSLFAAYDLAEARLLAHDTLQVDTDGFLRLFARDPRDGAALADLPVSVTLRSVPAATEADPEPAAIEHPLFTGRTDAQGLLAAPLRAGAELIGQHELVVRLETAAGPQELRANVAVQRATKVLLTTDKPLYQPGQKIHLRALALNRPSLAPAAGAPVVFEVYDGKNNKVERVARVADDFGVASYVFGLANEVNMGRYRLVATIGEGGESVTEKTVTVERYTLPKFDATITLDREVYFAGDRVTGTLDARYFFGQPVAGGQVAISASTLDAGETVFAQLQGATNAEGLYRFEFDLPDYLVGQPLAQGGGLVSLALEITDTAGQSRTIARTLRVAKGPLEVIALPESGAHVPGIAQQLLIRSTDAAGRPVAAEHQISIGGEVIGTVETDASGLGSLRILRFDPVLEIDVTSVRGEDRVVNTFTYAAEQTGTAAVLVTTPQALYRVGDTLNADIQVSGATDTVFLDVVRGGQTVLTDVLQPDADGRAHFELALGPDHAGALTVSAYTLGRGSDLRRDAATVYVDPADGLQVSITADREVYAPGDEAELTVRVTDADGNPRAAAVGLQGVDEAVYSLMEFRPGLENTWFRIEGELAEPRYQVGGPGLATLAGNPGAVDDADSQAQARMLFAAAGDTGGYAVDRNTWREAQAAVVPRLKPPLQAALDALALPIEAELNASNDPWNFDLAGRVAREPGPIYDFWGQPMTLSAASSQQLSLVSAGPDEVLGTDDDLRVSKEVFGGWRGQDDFDNAGGFPAAEGGGEGPPPQAPDPGTDEDGAGGGAVRVRRNFPETLFVEPALIVGGDGEARLTIPLADSITTWRISALANSVAGLLGSTDAGLRVFQDFFVDVAFPATLTRGDEYAVPVAVYNYLDRPQTVRLEVQQAEWLTVLGDANPTIQLAAGEVGGLRIPVRVNDVGLHGLTVIARGETLSDGVERTVRVMPDGELFERAESGALEAEVTRTVQVPAEAVPGSGNVFVKLYPGVVSQVVDGMDGILQMPSGCFEQTSSTTWPNVLVAAYLATGENPDPEIMLRAMEYINTGYQRLLTFEVDGGGFEWFGQPPSHTVLTAYGLLEFTDMARVRQVDEGMMARTRAWLIAQQGADGHWIAARGFDETGQLTDPVSITAYVAFALAAAGERGPSMALARDFLRGSVDQMGTYSLALTANFLTAWGGDAALSGRVFDRLATAIEAQLDEDVGQHWETDEQTTTYGNGPSAWIETTALATHALLVSRTHPQLAEKALAWLVTQKSPGGAWGSTAGTVWTIKSLLAAAGGGRDATADATVRVLLDGVERGQFRIDGTNSDVMRQADLSAWLTPGAEQTVTLQVDGTAKLNYGVITRHYMPWAGPPPGDGPLHIAVSYDRTTLSVDDTVTATVAISNDDAAYADMVMVDLGIPPGFDLVTADLEALRAAGTIARFETTQRQLILYFTRVEAGEPLTFTYRLVARDPVRAEAPPSRIYSYYNPEIAAAALPTEFQVD